MRRVDVEKCIIQSLFAHTEAEKEGSLFSDWRADTYVHA